MNHVIILSILAAATCSIEARDVIVPNGVRRCTIHSSRESVFSRKGIFPVFMLAVRVQREKIRSFYKSTRLLYVICTLFLLAC